MKKIQPAERVSEIKEYYFAGKLAEVAALNAQGLDIVSLGIGGPDRPPHESVIAMMQEQAGREDTHSYQPFKGLPELRRAFAEWYRERYGVTLNPDTEILPLLGSKEAILQLALTFLNPGDGVLVPDPGYPTYTSACRIAGAKILTYDLTPERGWYPDFDALEEMDLTGVKLMLVNYPHMPTGTPARADIFRKIVDFGRRHGIVIAHDNPYSFILNEHPMSILSVEGAKEICIELNSLSKSHNMAGWRVAMMASNPEFISWVVKVKSNVDSGMFRPTMLAAARALTLGDEWYREINNTYGSRRALAEEIMTALGCSFDPAQRGMFLWGRIPDSEESGEALADRVLKENRVFITPGFIFGRNGDRYIRISLCAPLPRLREALKRL